MKHIFENSSSISSAEYDTVDNVLSVMFNSGKTYRYADVPKEIYQELIEARSAGKFFQAYIKPVYKVVE